MPGRIDAEVEEATMTDSTYRQRGVNQASAGGGNAVYALGLIGALVYFWQQATRWVSICSGHPQSPGLASFLVYGCSRASSVRTAR